MDLGGGVDFSTAAAAARLAASNLSSWWDEINESPKWQDGVFYFLCAAYALVSYAALVQLIRIQLRVPQYGWTAQKVFHFMNLIVNGVRAFEFGFHTQVFLFRPKVFTIALLDLPSLFFFSTYTLLVLFWAEIYNQARNFSTDKIRIAYICINTAIYIFQVCIWVYLLLSYSSIVDSLGKIFIAVVSFIAALGFAIFGGRLFCMLRRFPIESKGRRKKLHEVGSVTGICFACFLIRCIVVGLSAFNANASLEVLDHPILDLVYYMLTEILPSALVLYILRRLPPKRVSTQYHPIQ
ncbi:tobamovirus multiplication protein 1-like [Zingiber officinale]|uniref:THH1/TOM1/TOM3 domain-containing protein n=1 Tax=Zingiber officinale TaxID=94328 RepID=A0A8J5BYA2_ZINOF|nr:tobamovirus multiplication protein 1-like [Zingiber officinale]KAG6467576.1 hypothetical protein ZIOFF_074606 [Zingiber officinale]